LDVKDILLKVLILSFYQLLNIQAYDILFEEVLSEIFGRYRLPQLNDLEKDPEIVAYLQSNELEPYIIRNLIVKDLPIPAE
jgi:hypothetical protein